MLSCNEDFKGCKNHLYKLVNLNSIFNLSDEILVLNQGDKGAFKANEAKAESFLLSHGCTSL